MAFQTPISNPLTETQDKLLAQMGALKSLVTLPEKKYKVLSKDQQISAYDYLVKLAETIVGPVFVDTILKKFLDEVFNPNNDKLERVIIKGLARSLDQGGRRISDSSTNKEWLEANVLPGMKVGFRIAKALIAKQIVAMIFGPKESMRPSKIDSTGKVVPDGDANPDKYLNYAVCSSGMFTVSNTGNVPDGDLEYNSVKLKERLAKGEMQFVISCQTVKIKLPEEQMNTAIADIVKNNRDTNATPRSATAMFNVVDAHVGAEVQRINSPENVNAVRKSFLQTLVEQLLSLIAPAIEPFMGSHLDKVIEANPSLGLTRDELLPTPCSIRSLAPATGQEASEEFKRKAMFSSVLMNALYAILISMLLTALIKEAKRLVKNALAKKALGKVRRRANKLKMQADLLNQAGEAIEKAQKMRAALASLDSILNFNKT